MADLRTALQEALGPLYRVEREVRAVGVCRMFVALETAGGPALLVKVLPGDLSLAVDEGLLERELLLLAKRLQGPPPVVLPRGAGRAGAFVYHTRAFVEGTTLRAWLARNGELPLRRAVDVLRDVLTALAHAHAAKIVHGDLKPENVLLTEGRSLVADTGVVGAVNRSLARAAPGSGSATGALCTATYVAPERRTSASDGGPITPPDDMYAVGVIIYEMLTARPPAPESESLEEARSIPPWLAELARRCLAPEPGGRWPDAGAALATVARPSGGIAGVE